MIKLEITNKDQYVYYLKDEQDNKYSLNLEFLDVKENLEIGDYITMSIELLHPQYEGYSTIYTFGSLDSKYGKKNIQLTDIDVIRIETKGKEIYLKRLYG